MSNPIAPTGKSQAAINLTEEIELREQLRFLLSDYIHALTIEITPASEPNSAFDLAELLLEVRELQKKVKEQEAQVREKLSAMVPKSGLLQVGHLIVFRESRERTDLDKAKLRADLGSLEKYEKKTSYTTVSVKRGEAV